MFLGFTVEGFRVLGFKIQGLGLDFEPQAYSADENCCVTWDCLSWPQGDWERESLYCKWGCGNFKGTPT